MKGSCLCGQIKFEVMGEFESFYLCHCHFCQKDTGSAHAANLFSTAAKLKWVQGEEQVRNYNLSGTRHAKAFCQNCGSAMPSVQMQGNLLVVPAGSLDSEVTLKPKSHIFYSSRASWDNELEKIEKADTTP
ncbi:MAG: GFA family protein [Bdellovibrionaceae bacterium]|nr:GFA family protein [Pseudobdellovibrionaceae bacterium]